MAARRLVVELTLGDEDVTKLIAMTRSRTEPASRVERARMLLAYRDDPSFFAVGRALGMHHQTVHALDDSPRPGRDVSSTAEAKEWRVDLTCRKAKDLGYPTRALDDRLSARHAREHAPTAGHACLVGLVQGTVCKILDAREVKPHKMGYYLKRRDPEFAEKTAQILCVYKGAEILKEATAASKAPTDAMAIISYDEKPGVQAIGATAPDLPPKPGVHATFARDHEYKRHGTLSLLAGIDLLTCKLHALVEESHRLRAFIEFLGLLDAASIRRRPRSS